MSMSTIKTTEEVAMALCEPLFNLTSTSGVGLPNSNHIEPDRNGMIGVACSAMYLSDLSALLKQQFTNFEETAVYVRERKSGKILASSGHILGYYDARSRNPTEPLSWIFYAHEVEAPRVRTHDQLIAWSADMLAEYGNDSSIPTDQFGWPLHDVTILRDVQETRRPETEFNNLTAPGP